MNQFELTVERLDSPVGALLLVSQDGVLCALEFADHAARMRKLLTKRFGAFRLLETTGPSAASAAIEAYLAGRLESLAELPADGGGTAFQHRVWSALREIPVGSTVTYGELAARLQIPKAVRAVASANALNPISIVVPCHRVIGSDGHLRGYSGGLARKRWLLTHEGVAAPDRQTNCRRGPMADDNGAQRIEDCINETCPWSGKPVQADSLTLYQGRVVGFCNPGCRDKFDTAIRHFGASAG